MNRVLKQRLEEYLDGRLSERDRAEFDACMARNPRDRKSISRMKRISACFSAFEAPEDAPLGPSPGFHAAVRARVEEQRTEPFWSFFLQPLAMQRVAYASCAWLFLVLSAGAYQMAEQAPSAHQAAEIVAGYHQRSGVVASYYPMPERASNQSYSQSILCGTPASEAYCNVRLGADLDTNRSLMLAAVMVSGSTGW